KDGCLPGRRIHVESARLQVATIAVVDGCRELILEAPLPAIEIRERQPHVALALVGGIVDGHQQALAARTLPGEGHETVPRPVSLPRWQTLEQLPLTLAGNRLAQHAKKAIVKLLHLLVHGFSRTATQMRRDPLSSSIELSPMEKAQPRRQKGDDGRCL